VASVRPDQSFKGRQFTAEVILWAVRWYLMFPVSYHDLELMLADRGVKIAHTTILRWVQTYAPEIEKRIRLHLRSSNGSWRVDETAKCVSRERLASALPSTTVALICQGDKHLSFARTRQGHRSKLPGKR
jgi:hypothetical protein